MIVQLTRGKVAIIDREDLPAVSQFKWFAQRSRNGVWYAGRNKTKACPYRRMHHLVLGTSHLTDHINGDGLDNRRKNLRLATPRQNALNRRTSRPIRGVYRHGRKWHASITVNRRYKFLGSYGTKEEAISVYDRALRESGGEFARPNIGGVYAAKQAA